MVTVWCVYVRAIASVFVRFDCFTFIPMGSNPNSRACIACKCICSAPCIASFCFAPYLIYVYIHIRFELILEFSMDTFECRDIYWASVWMSCAVLCCAVHVMSHVYWCTLYVSVRWCRYVLFYSILCCFILLRLVRFCSVRSSLFCSSNSRKHVTVSYRWIELFRCMRNTFSFAINSNCVAMYTNIYNHQCIVVKCMKRSVIPCVLPFKCVRIEHEVWVWMKQGRPIWKKWHSAMVKRRMYVLYLYIYTIYIYIYMGTMDLSR